MASEAGQAARQICEMLSGLVGRSVSPEAVASPPKIDAKPAYIATYVNEDGSVVGLCRCDLAAAASLGAALSMLPAGRVDDCIRSSSLDEMLYENFWEVCNVVSVFLTPHTSLFSHSRQWMLCHYRVTPASIWQRHRAVELTWG